MNSLKLSTIIFLVASGLTLVKLESCSIQNVQIVCRSLTNVSWPLHGVYLLTCQGASSIISTIPGSSVSSVVHSNGSEVTTLQIQGFSVNRARDMKFIPSGIGIQMQNLKAFQLTQCGLLEVNKGNFKEFGSSLEFLYLAYNKLTFIDGDLFKYNLNLKYVYFNDNPIRYIDPEFFTNLIILKNVQFVSFKSVNCMDQSSTKVNGETFKWKNERCIDGNVKIEAIMAHYLAQSDQCKSIKLSKKIEEIIRVNQNLLESSELQTAEISRLTGENVELRRQINNNMKSKADSMEKMLNIFVNMSTQLCERPLVNVNHE